MRDRELAQPAGEEFAGGRHADRIAQLPVRLEAAHEQGGVRGHGAPGPAHAGDAREQRQAQAGEDEAQHVGVERRVRAEEEGEVRCVHRHRCNSLRFSVPPLLRPQPSLSSSSSSTAFIHVKTFIQTYHPLSSFSFCIFHQHFFLIIIWMRNDTSVMTSELSAFSLPLNYKGVTALIQSMESVEEFILFTRKPSDSYSSYFDDYRSGKSSSSTQFRAFTDFKVLNVLSFLLLVGRSCQR
jgi:hypothetical protein